jgi:formylmethanofuran dehydrogenase subunit B
MWSSEPSRFQGNLTCPFCGLACDDLSVGGEPHEAEVDTRGCPLAKRRFEEALAANAAPPRLGHREAPLAEVVAHAAMLLREARSPLIAGLATDVNGMRAALELAERCGARLDHMNGDALFRDLLVQQQSGWMTTTFTEVCNRADLIVVVGTECFERFPRLCERVLFPVEALFSSTSGRELVLIGPWTARPLPGNLAALRPTVIPVALHRLASLMGMLRALMAHRPVRTDAFASDSPNVLSGLADRLRGARYAVVVWAAGELDFPHAELAVEALSELVCDLNEHTRAGALPLAGSEGDITVNQVCTWQTGYPLRTGLQQGHPRYEPILNRYQDVLARGESDLLVWVSALSAQATPPPRAVPTVVLGHPAMTVTPPPAAYIPVGIPGIDHPGHWYRGDAACPLPLGRVRQSELPSVAEGLRQILDRL